MTLNPKTNRYRRFDTEFHHLGNGQVIASHSLKNTYRVYPKEISDFLSSCQEFKPLDEHVYHILRVWKQRELEKSNGSFFKKTLTQLVVKSIKHGVKQSVPKHEIYEIRSHLQSLVSDGLLISEKELLARVSKISRIHQPNINKRTDIRILGIPTRNRKEQLIRCVDSYLENLYHHGREFLLCIADDSDNNAESLQSQKEVVKLANRYKTDVVWADKPWRKTYSSTLAKRAGVSKVVVEFALVGDMRCKLRTGACRNTLLLLSAGNSSVQVDDDTVCDVFPSPWIRKGLALSSRTDNNQYRFFLSYEQAMQQVTKQHRDFFSLHEEFLGKHPTELASKEPIPNIASLETGMLEKLSQSGLRIAVTYAGALGDSGLRKHWWKLFLLQKESFEHFINDELLYQKILCSRLQIRAPDQITISDGPFYMPMNIGIDSRRFIPPFTPVQRNQDGPFSQLLYMGFKDVCRGYSPWAIIHRPKGRPIFDERSKASFVGPFRLPDILEAIIWSFFEWPFGDDPKYNTQIVGQYLLDLGSLSPHKFQSQIHHHCLQNIQGRIYYLRKIMDERYDAPEYWKKDANKVLVNFQQLMKHPDLHIPDDLPGSNADRMALSQDIISKFGQLLISWPDIWEAAEELNSSGNIEQI